jgi:general secretion pathway protein A
MYEQFFGFRERPFDLTPNPRYLVLTAMHREALSNLRYAIASRKGVTLLVGEAGSGKTTVIKAALEGQPQLVHCVHLHNPALTRDEFVELLSVRFGLSDRARTSKAALLIELEELLRRRHSAGETTVLIVDEAQSLPIALIEEVRLLANIETESDKLLSVIIAGQPEIADRLNQESLRQLKQRIALRCELKPLALRETLAYITGRIRAAGGEGAQVFTREAVMMIHEQARGVPRTINVLADNALLAGFATGQRPVGTRIVSEVCRDFDLRAATECASFNCCDCARAAHKQGSHASATETGSWHVLSGGPGDGGRRAGAPVDVQRRPSQAAAVFFLFELGGHDDSRRPGAPTRR